MDKNEIMSKAIELIRALGFKSMADDIENSRFKEANTVKALKTLFQWEKGKPTQKLISQCIMTLSFAGIR